MNESKMSEEFHEWLSLCPVNWNRLDHSEEGATYFFNNEQNQ